MKKTFLLTLAVAMAVSACQKGDEPAPSPSTPNNPGNNGNVGTVPSTFTQKVLLETFVGAWCNTCPDADVKRDQAVATNSNRIVSVSAHQTDGMSIALFSALYPTFSQYSPSGMVNRTPSLGNVLLSPSQWQSNISVALGKTAACGLAVETSGSGATAGVVVHAGFNATVAGDIRLVAYLVEDSVTGTGSGFDQMNAYNNSIGSPFYNMGNPIVNYHHNRVVRAVLTAHAGDAIPAANLVAGGEFVRSFSNVDITAYDAARLHVVAFITRVGTTATTHEVLNVQTVAMGSVKNWD